LSCCCVVVSLHRCVVMFLCSHVLIFLCSDVLVFLCSCHWQIAEMHSCVPKGTSPIFPNEALHFRKTKEPHLVFLSSCVVIFFLCSCVVMMLSSCVLVFCRNALLCLKGTSPISPHEALHFRKTKEPYLALVCFAEMHSWAPILCFVEMPSWVPQNTRSSTLHFCSAFLQHKRALSRVFVFLCFAEMHSRAPILCFVFCTLAKEPEI